MNLYEQLLAEYDDTLIICEESMHSHGLYCDGCVWINESMPTAKKTSVLAEEIGHYMTSVGDILDQSDLNNAKQERRARVWAFNKIIPIERITEAAAKGYTQVYEMAEYLDVDEDFLREGLAYHGILDISL